MYTKYTWFILYSKTLILIYLFGMLQKLVIITVISLTVHIIILFMFAIEYDWLKESIIHIIYVIFILLSF